jgi:hypothetical protein
MSHVRINRFRVTVTGLAAAGALVVGSPLMSPAAASTRAAAAAASTYGGATSQGLPVIVDVNASKRLVVRVLTAVRLNCTPSGGRAITPDGYRRLRVTKQGKFSASFGPTTQRNADGTTTDVQGRMTARFNRARTQITGTWHFTATDHDATGVVTDTCDSGAVVFRAKQ